MSLLGIFNPKKRSGWALLVGSAFLLELAALAFQYVWDLQPCIKCVYQRIALWGICLAALPALVCPQSLICRLLSYLAALVSAIWGVKVAGDHLALQNAPNPLFASCELVPNFPAWFKPDVWLPALFEPRGDCGNIDWTFLNMSMPQWMQIIFVVYVAALTISLIYSLIKRKSL
ncbi:disulfide bond formation protein DsbB [Gayadomonas joobiniege]|uniref:disulfide bond formation protein DsbB n=1 Tax=Gayadomonas joobiniege TaxID=1234606 RepID=UPI00037D3A96|nr:disulfide bond formation protein DsbB [Gayadomonas joobiniege]